MDEINVPFNYFNTRDRSFLEPSPQKNKKNEKTKESQSHIHLQ